MNCSVPGNWIAALVGVTAIELSTPGTVRRILADWEAPPADPVTVMTDVVALVDGPVVIVMTEAPAPVIEVGLKLTLTPVGSLVADRIMTELKPLLAVLVMVEIPEPPGQTVTGPDDAERTKWGPDALLIRSLIRLDPFGLPQPLAKSYPTVAGKPLLPLVMSWKSVS